MVSHNLQKIIKPHPKKVLFVISIIQYFIEAKNLFLYFKEKGYDVTLLLGWTGDKLDESIIFCKKNKIRFHTLPSEFSYKHNEKNKKISKISSRDRILFFFLRLPLVERFLTIYANIMYISRLKKYFKSYFEKNHFNCVLSGPFSSIGKFDNVIASYCKNLKIPFLCFPVFNDICESFNIESRSHLLKVGMLSKILYVNYDIVNILLSFLFPDWVRKKDKKRFFMHDPILLLTSKFHRILEKNIWAKPSKLFDFVFVESLSLKNHLIEIDKWSSEKVIVSGKPSAEEIFKMSKKIKYKKKIYSHLNLKYNENFILYNVEPAWEHNYIDKKDHWKHFEEICEILNKTKKKIVLSLHPMCDLKNYKYVIKKFNFRISTKFRIFDLLPHCLFVVSHFCTTNLLANKLGKKTLVVDLTNVSTNEGFSTEGFKRSKNSMIVKSYPVLQSAVNHEILKKKNVISRNPFLESSKIIFNKFQKIHSENA